MSDKVWWKRHGNRVKVINTLIKGKDILDIGSTQPAGKFHAYLVSKNPDKKFFTLDLDGKPDFKMDLNKPRKLGRKFDTIIAADVIEHLDNPKNLLKFCYQHLDKGGRLILATPNAIGLQYIINEKWCIFEPTDIENHIECFTLPMLNYLMQKTGFRIVKESYINAYWNYNPIKVIPFLIKKIRPCILIAGEK